MAVIYTLFLGGCRDAASIGQHIFEQGLNYIAGTDADENLFYALSAFNFEGMREAVEDGADVNALNFSATVTGGNSPLYWLLTGEGKIGYDSYGNCTNVDFIEYLLEQGADPNEINSKGQSLIMLCCEADGFGYMGAGKILEQLLLHGADVTLTDNEKKTALDYAVMSGNSDYISLLLEHGAAPTQQTLTLAFTLPRTDYFQVNRAMEAKTIWEVCPAAVRTGDFPPLLLDAVHGDGKAVIAGISDCPKADLSMLAQLTIAFCDTDAVQAVKDAGFSFTTWKDGETSDNGQLYVEIALLSGCADTALWLMNEIGYAEVDALKFSAKHGLADMTAFFLEHGIFQDAMPQDVDGFEWEVFDNLLADSAGNAEIVRLLFEADYPTNKLSLTQALNQAIVMDNIDSIRYLCETAGADVSYLPEGIGSAMETACMHGNLSIVEYLQSQGASLNAEKGYLSAAVMKHHTEIAEYLLRHGIPPDSYEVYEDGGSGWSPLLYAIQDGRFALVKILVEAGADVNSQQTSDNDSTLHYAARNQSARILQYLIDAGADITVVNQEGMNAADVACTQANLAILTQVGCIPQGTK